MEEMVQDEGYLPLFPTPHAMTSYWQLASNHDSTVFITEISKCRSGLSLHSQHAESVANHLLIYHWFQLFHVCKLL